MKNQITKLFLISISFLISGLIFSQAHAAKGGKDLGPCKKIAEACEQAGFIKGDWKKGDGLWADCACPAITGKPNPKATKTAPTIDAALITACKEKKPQICAKYMSK